MHSESNSIIFSIIVPTYNRAHLISKTLDSILAQTYSNFEVIVVDDGSTDNTEEIITNNYIDRVRYFKKENEERSIARNFGTQKAIGNYVIWFDSDDIMYSNYLELANKKIKTDKQPEVIAFSHDYLDQQDRIVSKVFINDNTIKNLHKGNYFSCNAIIVRHDIAVKNPFNPELSFGEDYQLWLRLASQFKFATSTSISSAIVLHNERSMVKNTKADDLIHRLDTFLHEIKKDKNVLNFLGNNKSYFIMKNYLIIAVDLAHNNHKKQAFHYLKLAAKANKKIIFTKTYYATLKHLIF